MFQKKIAFLRKGPWPAANEQVPQILLEHFPDHAVDVIEVADLIRKRQDIALANSWHIVREYGRDILLGRKKIKDCFFRTTYIFDAIKALVAERLAQEPYTFSFQMQSMFDAAQRGRPHFIYTDHTHLANLYYPDFDRRGLYGPRWIARERTIYHDATLVFTRSTNISRSLVEQYGCPPEKVVCVFAGSNVKADRLLPVDPAKYGRKSILFVGIDWERKGGPELAEAFKSVLRVHPDAQLVIVGCSPRLDLPNCTIVGRLPLEAVKPYYERASIFCLPTKLEPFGIVFIEALSHRLPIVATDIGAIPDFVVDGQNGYLVKPRAIPQLAEALIRLLDDPARCQVFGERGYQLAQSRYQWESVGAMMHEHIQAALGERVLIR